MRSRRRFLRLSLAALAASGASLLRAQGDDQHKVWAPTILSSLPATAPPPGDAPLLGQASGTTAQAIEWLAPRARGYTPDDVINIVARYEQLGDWAAVDWFLALAQMAHETGSLTSWWCQRPRCNPAGIGVTGAVQPGVPEVPPGPDWAWDGVQWRQGITFYDWFGESVPAHLGRLLAYALRDDQADANQLALIQLALSYRPLPAGYRGIAPTILGLNGRWAYPGTTYGQSILALAAKMRGA